MKKEEFRSELERRIAYARCIQSTAPVATVLEDVLTVLNDLEIGNGQAEKPDRMLTVKEAAPRLDMSPAWLYRNADSLPFVKKYPTGSVKISEKGLERWLSRQR